MIESKTICLNGALKVGDTVLSTPISEYSCLVGVVTDIHPLGSKKHDEETENYTDDVWVDFSNNYSNQRQAEILDCFQRLYEDPKKTFDDICWEVIMAPCELIRLDQEIIKSDYLQNSLLNAEATASAYAFAKCLEVCSKPIKNAYSVTRIVCKGGELSQETEYYPAVHTAWDIACDYYAELRSRYRYSTADWKDTSIREKGVFTGHNSIGDYFKIYIQEHARGGPELFGFFETAE